MLEPHRDQIILFPVIAGVPIHPGNNSNTFTTCKTQAGLPRHSLTLSPRNDGVNSIAVAQQMKVPKSSTHIQMKQPCVYIVTNKRNGTLYTGVTSDLIKRVYEHKKGRTQGFTQRYGCKRLVWYELHETMEFAILREKQLKAGSRKKELALIEATNSTWRDLYSEILG